MLNIKPLLVRQHLQGNHGFDSLESTLFENACIVISQIVASIAFLRGKNQYQKVFIPHIIKLSFNIITNFF